MYVSVTDREIGTVLSFRQTCYIVQCIGRLLVIRRVPIIRIIKPYYMM